MKEETEPIRSTGYKDTHDASAWCSPVGAIHKKSPVQGLDLDGAQGRNRTTDTRIFNPGVDVITH